MWLAGMLIVLGQASAADSRAPERAHHGACPAIEVTSAQDPKARPGRVPSFSVRRIIDLEFTAGLRSAPARGVLRLKVRAPGGFLYRTLTVSLADARRHRVSASLPVAGTLITSNGLYGRWTVEPWLDGAAEPCGMPQPFVIVE